MDNKYNVDYTPGVYFGSRGSDFVTMMTDFIKKGKLEPDFENYLIKKIKFFDIAFTSSTANQTENYEVLEQIGDSSGGKFLIDYFYKKFPQLNCPEGVKICARLKINYGSKNSFYKIADQYKMWNFISARNDDRNRNKKSLLEDVFEAVLGKIETIINNAYGIENGYGYGCVFSILEKIFDEMQISLKYEDLYDSKTILKELFDANTALISKLTYTDSTTDKGLKKSTISCLFLKTNTIVTLGHGSATIKQDAEQNAAKIALSTLKNAKIEKKIPEIYQTLSKQEKIKLTKQEIQALYKNINDSVIYDKKKDIIYTSTPLSIFCSKRDVDSVKICMELDANTQTRDSDTMTPAEKVTVGSFNPSIVGNILAAITKKSNCQMRKVIYDIYFSRYLSPENVKNEKNLKYFQTINKKIIITEPY